MKDKIFHNSEVPARQWPAASKVTVLSPGTGGPDVPKVREVEGKSLHVRAYRRRMQSVGWSPKTQRVSELLVRLQSGWSVFLFS